MTSLFFLMSILFMFHEIGNSLNPSKAVKFIKNSKNKDFYKNKNVETSEKLGGCWFALVQMFYLTWGILGLAFSHQWISFGLLFIIGIVAALVQKGFRIKELDESRTALFLRRIDSIICSIILLDIFMCHFRSDFWGEGIVMTMLGL